MNEKKERKFPKRMKQVTKQISNGGINKCLY